MDSFPAFTLSSFRGPLSVFVHLASFEVLFPWLQSGHPSIRAFGIKTVKFFCWVSLGDQRVFVYLASRKLRSLPLVPAGSPSRGGNVAVYVFDLSQPSLPTPFFLFEFCSCVYFWLYGPFNYILFHTSPDNSPLSHSVLLILFLPYGSFQLYICLWKSPSALI